jgi:hypothetical protein
LFSSPAVDRCLSFEYAIGNVNLGAGNTRINVYREGNGIFRKRLRRIQETTNNAWQNVSICIEAVQDLKVNIHHLDCLILFGHSITEEI